MQRVTPSRMRSAIVPLLLLPELGISYIGSHLQLLQFLTWFLMFKPGEARVHQPLEEGLGQLAKLCSCRLRPAWPPSTPPRTTTYGLHLSRGGACCSRTDDEESQHVDHECICHRLARAGRTCAATQHVAHVRESGPIHRPCPLHRGRGDDRYYSADQVPTLAPLDYVNSRTTNVYGSAESHTFDPGKPVTRSNGNRAGERHLILNAAHTDQGHSEPTSKTRSMEAQSASFDAGEAARRAWSCEATSASADPDGADRVLSCHLGGCG